MGLPGAAESLDYVPPMLGTVDEYTRIFQQQNVNAEAITQMLASGESFDPYVLRRKLAIDILLQGRLDRFNPFNEYKPAKNLSASHVAVVELLGNPKAAASEDGWMGADGGGGILALSGLLPPGTLLMETRTRVAIPPPAEFSTADFAAPARSVAPDWDFQDSDKAAAIKTLIAAGRTTKEIENITGASRPTISKYRKILAAAARPDSVDPTPAR